MLSFQRQQKIITMCSAESLHLSDVLKREGLTYDDLRYRQSRHDIESRGRRSSLEELSTRSNGIPTISFFSGAGGMDLGFEAAGFNHVGSIEINPMFCGTIRANRPSWKVFNEDVSNRSRVASILKSELSVNAPFEGVFHGGPPCQPFSVAANQRFRKGTVKFKRTGFENEESGNLLFDYAYYIQQFRPAFFVIENVPGLIEVDGGEQLDRVLGRLSSSGYAIVGPMLLNTSDYGVPQDRKRLIVIGARKMNKLWKPLPVSSKIPCGAVLTADVRRYPGHVTREHEVESIQRYVELQYGQRERMGRVDRLDPTLPSKTVIAGGSGGGGRSHLHPEIPRTLSPRETARLQTFPDGYVFEGPSARQLTQIGNAVPPVFAAALARQIAMMAGVNIKSQGEMKPTRRGQIDSKNEIASAYRASRGCVDA